MPEGSEPISHRTPTEGTAKELYATAFRCGFEGCRKPLYRMNDETGEHLLNSRIAHICARSEGGPRWDAAMSEDDNRSAANLMPMCLDHAAEIDETPTHYPVELLHQWKRAQIAERWEMQKAWELTEDEAKEVIQSSFGAVEYGTALTGASCVAAAARAVGTLIETARQKRRLPQKAAEAWQVMRLRTQQYMPLAWDAETGELLGPPEPPRAETRQYQQALDNALGEVKRDLQPLIVVLVGELHTVRALADRLMPWCDWIEHAAQKVLSSSSRWPGTPPEPDDEQLSESIEELARAIAALSAAWSGQDAEQPPPPPPFVQEETESEPQRLYREHRELLDSARPWARVKGRAFDPELYARLIEAAEFALGLPSVPSFLGYDLQFLTGLASDVARNADDDTFTQLIEEAALLRPIAVAVFLIRDLRHMAEETGRDENKARATGLATELLVGADWSAAETWLENRFQVRLLMAFTVSVTSEAEVFDRVAEALSTEPRLLKPILHGASAWIEERSTWDLSLNAIKATLEDPPAWFPVHLVAEEIRRQHPEWEYADVTVMGEDDVKRLAQQILKLAGNSGTT